MTRQGLWIKSVENTSIEARNIVLGVTGGIAAYKSAELVRRLRERGANVRVVMTQGAEAFVTALTFQALSTNPVHSKLLDASAEAGMGHIELARWADLVLIAPATADFIAKLASGQADDLLSTLCLATRAPLFLAPAMNTVMWEHPATQDNCRLLEQREVRFLGPGEGSQACGETGPGRMLEPLEIINGLVLDGPLNGTRFLITAGPTFEDLDPVRFLGNRSSGRMGFAIAQVAVSQGANVTLVAGPVDLPTPAGVERVDVRSALEMHDAVMQRTGHADIFVATAAVADFRPASMQSQKIKKGQADSMTLELRKNPDILAAVAALESNLYTLGFAAETNDLASYARRKLMEKGADMIAANQVGGQSGGFDRVDNELTLFWRGGEHHIPLASKTRVAAELISVLIQRYNDQKEMIASG
jgi:phosphopantothenoylcysteine decarboxylase/phosphopantothenate--cysteine ligase